MKVEMEGMAVMEASSAAATMAVASAAAAAALAAGRVAATAGEGRAAAMVVVRVRVGSAAEAAVMEVAEMAKVEEGSAVAPAETAEG